MEIHESDSSGRRVATYILSTSEGEKMKEGGSGRVDIVRPQKEHNDLVTWVWNTLLEIFLPVGFPASVTDDYLPYQIYDSLQAFSSSIAGLLSSRAVLEGVGVGDSTASPTSALLLHILQDSTGRISTILFAHRFGSALEPECKRYRLLADVLNDCAMLLDCLSPVLPRGVIRVSVLSTAGVLRALCGVAAGAAKASLSVHFARRANVGELNAKDASQETVISLMGMLAGSLVVSYIVSPEATWTCLILLLAIHLGMNHAAVRAVRMNTLNRQRACLCFSHLFDTGSILSPEEVSNKERIFERSSFVRWNGGTAIGRARIGVSLYELVSALGRSHHVTKSVKEGTVAMAELVDAFASDGYLLWYDQSQDTVLIALKSSADPASQLRAWAHAMLVLQGLQQRSKGERGNAEAVLKLVVSSLGSLKRRWKRDVAALAKAGWDLDTASLETVSGTRVDLNAGTLPHG